MPSHLLFIPEQLFQNHQWLADSQWLQNSFPKEISPWLCETGSLTTAIKAIAKGTFKVNVLSQRVGIPVWHEQRKLGRALHHAALIREVELTIFDQAIVCARSIIPLQLANSGANGLANLGATPLGHLLFKDGRMTVSKREFLKPRGLVLDGFARRTPYEYQGSQILVSEFFLAPFQKYCQQA